jgi:DNA repair protein RecO (recombination protein O)
MATIRDRCICLRKVEYSETSQILSLLGRSYGLVRVIARGAHRTTKAGASRFSGGVDLLDIGEAVFTDRPEKDLATLTEWKLTEGHLQLRRNLRAVYLGMYAVELVGLLIEEHDPHPELYDTLEHCLLELGSPRAEQAFLAFELDLLRETGYLPELGACVACGSALAVQLRVCFIAGRGGVVCESCATRFPERRSIDGRLLSIVQYVLNLGRSNGASRRLPVLTRHQTDPINRLLAGHIQHTLGRRLRVAGYVT